MENKERLPERKSAGLPVHSPMPSPHRILVVDSDNDIRQLSVDVLAGSSYNVEAVSDAAAGWKALQANHYDLIITENWMPGMTGIEMIEKLRSAHLALPVIMATRYLPAHEIARKPWLKSIATVEWPADNDDLLEAVKKVLGPDNRNVVPARPTP